MTKPSLRRTFAVPLVIGIASMIGLIAALLGDGINNLISWIGLAVPLIAIAWAWTRRRA